MNRIYNILYVRIELKIFCSDEFNVELECEIVINKVIEVDGENFEVY